MAEISVDQEILDLALRLSHLSQKIGSILQEYQNSTKKLIDGSVYDGKAKEEVKQAVDTIGIHISALLEYYATCGEYINYVWTAMSKVDEELAAKMFIEYITTNREQCQGEIEYIKEEYGIDV